MKLFASLIPFAFIMPANAGLYEDAVLSLAYDTCDYVAGNIKTEAGIGLQTMQWLVDEGYSIEAVTSTLTNFEELGIKDDAMSLIDEMGCDALLNAGNDTQGASNQYVF